MINKASNMTIMRYRVAIITGDVSAIIGTSGQDFCADLGIYAAYPDPVPQQPDTSTDNLFICFSVQKYCNTLIIIGGGLAQ